MIYRYQVHNAFYTMYIACALVMGGIVSVMIMLLFVVGGVESRSRWWRKEKNVQNGGDVCVFVHRYHNTISMQLNKRKKMKINLYGGWGKILVVRVHAVCGSRYMQRGKTLQLLNKKKKKRCLHSCTKSGWGERKY